MKAPTVRRRRLGAELRQFRERSGMTLEEVSEKTGLTVAKLSRLETARSAAKAPDVERIFDAYEIEDQELRAALLALAREGNKRGWWQSYKGVLSQPYEDLIALEAESSSIRTFHLALVPGLLQTGAYAKEAIRNTAMTAAATERVNALVEVRMARQSVLTSRDEPLELWAIIHESALHATCSSPSVMRDQLQRLLDVSELPNVSIQIMPAATALHAGTVGPFTLLNFPEHPGLDAVIVESLTNTLYVEDREHVEVYGQAFERLQAAALSFEDSLALIGQLKEQTS